MGDPAAEQTLEGESPETVGLLIADDHALFREGLRALLRATPDIRCVGEAATGEEAIERAALLKPDVVLMDINMAGISGIEATRRIARDLPGTRVIVVTMLEDDASIFAAMRAGARGYVLKGANHKELLQSIRAVAQGQVLLGPAVAARISQFFARPSAAAAQPLPELTEREREILACMARHETNPEIARQLGISVKTTSNHVSNILSKLQVADRAEAILRARQAGIDSR